MIREPHSGRSLDPARRQPRLARLSAVALLWACAVDSREFDGTALASAGAGGDAGSASGAALGGSSAVFGGGGGESASEAGRNPAGLGGSSAELGPNVTLLNNGSSCGAGMSC